MTRHVLLISLFFLVPFSAQAHIHEGEPLIIATYENTRRNVGAVKPVTRTTKRIISREEWGADESFLYETGEKKPVTSVKKPTTNDAPNTRVQDCLNAKRDHPEDFDVIRTEGKGPNGKTLRWKQSFTAPKMFVLHHLAMKDDDRSSVERMQALYDYHANRNGWGDVGYHYVIGKDGKIFQGRFGGPKVMGGHAYCFNNSTIGIAFDVNAEISAPSQAQVQSAKWLISRLARDLNINLRKRVTMHGKIYPAIVGHGDLMATACPGHFIRGALGQIVKQTIANDINGFVTFPKKIVRKSGNNKKRIESRRLSRLGRAGQTRQKRPTWTLRSTATLSGRPGGTVSAKLSYAANDSLIPRHARLGMIKRSHPRIGIWMERGGKRVRLREEITTREGILPGNTEDIQLFFQLPVQEGSYDVRIDDVFITLQAHGRRIQTPEGRKTRKQTFRPAEVQEKQIIHPDRRKLIGKNGKLGSRRGLWNTGHQARRSPRTTTARGRTTKAYGKPIRVRLSYDKNTAVIKAENLRVSRKTTDLTTITLKKYHNSCLAVDDRGVSLSTGIVRIEPSNDTFTVQSWKRAAKHFKGVLECRILDGKLVLINELPLEDYMKGLGEEPDTEPHQKQLAFAIAARSYAAHYMQEEYRKFPGKPYDLDDSPASSQLYLGTYFQDSNAAWVDAVEDTMHEVLMKDGEILKAAYFSSSDGRTRSPEEIGWLHFPHSEVFQSKPDPGCSEMRGHGVGMSGCGSKNMALSGKTYLQILEHYYPGTTVTPLHLSSQ